MKIRILAPATSEEFESYYNLRWQVLREPWGQTKGSERDKEDEVSHHRMIIDETTGDAVAVGRLQINSKDEAQIRYMAVAEGYQGQGLGRNIVTTLEDIALDQRANRIILQARETAFGGATRGATDTIADIGSTRACRSMAQGCGKIY